MERETEWKSKDKKRKGFAYISYTFRTTVSLFMRWTVSYHLDRLVLTAHHHQNMSRYRELSPV